jgi:hemoglobin
MLDGVTTPEPARAKGSFFAAVGGEETFRRLVRTFYAGVRQDPVLLPLYPPDEIDAAEERLGLFLIQYWGGPSKYDELRGHPRLRMRHAPFAIGPAERDAWLSQMRAAVDSLGLPAEYAEPLWSYLQSAAFAMQNTP